RGLPVDFRSDQFSFGAIVYEMATGTRAFARETAPEILSAIIRDEPKPLDTLNPRAPVPLRWIVGRCLAKEPSERYASTMDLAGDLRSMNEHLSDLSSSIAPTDWRPNGRFRHLATVLAAAAVGVAVSWLLRLSARNTHSAPQISQVTFRRERMRRGVFGA